MFVSVLYNVLLGNINAIQKDSIGGHWSEFFFFRLFYIFSNSGCTVSSYWTEQYERVSSIFSSYSGQECQKKVYYPKMSGYSFKGALIFQFYNQFRNLKT